MKPFISPTLYGVLNFTSAILLMSSPWLFNFAQFGGGALLVPIFLGWLQLIQSIFSDNPFSFIKVFPMQMQNCLDGITGLFLMTMPFSYGFYNNVFWPHLLLGGLLVFKGVFAQGSPFLVRATPSLPEAGITSTDSLEGRLNH